MTRVWDHIYCTLYDFKGLHYSTVPPFWVSYVDSLGLCSRNRSAWWNLCHFWTVVGNLCIQPLMFPYVMEIYCSQHCARQLYYGYHGVYVLAVVNDMWRVYAGACWWWWCVLGNWEGLYTLKRNKQEQTDSHIHLSASSSCQIVFLLTK